MQERDRVWREARRGAGRSRRQPRVRALALLHRGVIEERLICCCCAALLLVLLLALVLLLVLLVHRSCT